MPDMTPAQEEPHLPQDPRLARFLRARSEGRNAEFEWRFSLSDLETDEDLDLLTEAQALGLLEDEGGHGVFRITEGGKALAKAAAAPSSDTQADAEERRVLELFAARQIDRQEAEERTGLYFSEILIRMKELGIKRQYAPLFEGMSEAQKKLFKEIFAPPEPEDPSL